jgi:hypothetical protein
MRHERRKSGGVAAASSCHPERLLFEEMQVILVTIKQVHKQSARLREQSLAINSELARMRRDYDRSVASTPTKDRRRQHKPAADRPANDRAHEIVGTSRLLESNRASRGGAMQVLTAVNESLREAGYDVVDILDAAMKFALDRLLQSVGRQDAVRYLRYVTEEIDGHEH